MWKKILFGVLALIFGVFIAFMLYMSNMYSYIEDKAKAGEYTEVAGFYIPFFDSESVVVEDNTDKCNVVAYPALIESSYTDLNDETIYYIEEVYVLFLFNYSGLNFDDIIVSDSVTQNDSSITFYSASSNYVYPLVYWDDNSDANDIDESYDSVNNVFYSQYNLKKTLVDSKLDGAVTSFSITDAEGVAQLTKTVDFSFADAFFADTANFVSTYNDYRANGSMSDDEFQEYYDNWITSYKYSKIISKTPSPVIWRTIGGTALYVLVCGLIYIILFHRNLINFSRRNNEYIPGSRSKNREYINAQVQAKDKAETKDKIETKETINKTDK